MLLNTTSMVCQILHGPKSRSNPSPSTIKEFQKTQSSKQVATSRSIMSLFECPYNQITYKKSFLCSVSVMYLWCILMYLGISDPTRFLEDTKRYHKDIKRHTSDTYQNMPGTQRYTQDTHQILYIYF